MEPAKNCLMTKHFFNIFVVKFIVILDLLHINTLLHIYIILKRFKFCYCVWSNLLKQVHKKSHFWFKIIHHLSAKSYMSSDENAFGSKSAQT